MNDEEKAALWITIHGIPPEVAAKFQMTEKSGWVDITREPKWDEWEKVPRARGIGKQQWLDAYTAIMKLDESLPGLVAPVVGATMGGLTLPCSSRPRRRFSSTSSGVQNLTTPPSGR